MECPRHELIFAPEMFLAPGGIARVSRHYLQAVAEVTDPARLSAVVLNDREISPADLEPYHAERAEAHGCDRSKWRCAKQLWHLLRRPNTHVTCTHVAIAVLLVYLRKLGRNFTYDVVVHGIEVWRPISRPQQRALRGARLILSVSDYTRNTLVSRYPDLAAKTHVLPNALDPGFAVDSPSAAIKSPSPVILAVSRLAAHDWEKGIDHLIAALTDVRDVVPGTKLHIIGDGVDRPRLEAIAREKNVDQFVNFLGRVDDDALRQELAECTLFALPSRKEGFGLVYLEAMAAGKPCIVAQAGGAPEVIDETSGIAVPYGDVPSLAKTVSEALQRQWDIGAIHRRAAEFSFPAFVTRWQTLCFLNP